MVKRRSFFLRFLSPFLVSFTYIFLYVPIIVLAIFSFNKSPIPAKWVGFSLRWYNALILNPDILASFKTSLIVATCSTLISLILGTCFVLASNWWKSSVPFALFYMNVLLPEIVLAVGVLSMFAFFRIPVGYSSLIVGHTVLGLGFVVPIVRARFMELDKAITESSLDLGATYGQTFVRIQVPLLVPSLVASALLVFTLSLDDFLIAFFCSSPSVQTLSVYVYSLAKTGIDPTINALATFFLVGSSLLVLLLCSLKVSDKVLLHD